MCTPENNKFIFCFMRNMNSKKYTKIVYTFIKRKEYDEAIQILEVI